MGFFPDATSYSAQDLANFSEDYATITLVNESDPLSNVRLRCVFKNNLDLTDTAAGNGQLEMLITYSIITGYGKQWDHNPANTTVDAIYIPK
jgi:hypothetical protein